MCGMAPRMMRGSSSRPAATPARRLASSMPDHVLIEDVAGPRDRGLLAGVRVAIGAERRGVAGDQLLHLGQSRGIARGGVHARKAGDVLADGVAGDEAIGVIPAAHVVARRAESGALAVDLQQAIVIEREEVRVDPVVLLLERAAGEHDVGIRELAQLFARRAMRGRGRARGDGLQESSSGKHAGSLHLGQLVPGAVFLGQ